MDAEDWKRDCELANSYYSFLEDQLVNDVNAQVYPFQQLVTYERLNQILFCKQDCNFDRLLSVSSNFTANLTEFALNCAAQSLCLMVISTGVSIRTPRHMLLCMTTIMLSGISVFGDCAQVVVVAHAWAL